MPNSHNAMFHNPLEGNAHDPSPMWSDDELHKFTEELSNGKEFTPEELAKMKEGKVMQATAVSDEGLRQNWLKSYKPHVYSISI